MISQIKKHKLFGFPEWNQQPADLKQSLRDIPQLNAVNIDQPSPRPHRKLHPFKSAPKKQSAGTPPDSPTLPASAAISARKFR